MKNPCLRMSGVGNTGVKTATAIADIKNPSILKALSGENLKIVFFPNVLPPPESAAANLRKRGKSVVKARRSASVQTAGG